MAITGRTKVFAVLATLAILVFGLVNAVEVQQSEQASVKHGETDWPVYGGSPANTHYSKLAQINVDNVTTLPTRITIGSKLQAE